RIGGGVRTTVFQIALVAVVDEAVGNANRRTAVGETIGELVDRLGLVKTGEAQVVVRTIHGDVLVHVFGKRGHELLEVVLAAGLAHEGGREVRVHARAV